MLLLLSGACALQDSRAVQGPPEKQCTTLETALAKTREALDERRFELFGRVVREVMARGELSEVLRAQLDDSEALEAQIGGNRLQSLVGGLLELISDGLPQQTLAGLKVVLKQEERLPSVLGFFDAEPSRWQVLNPLREMLVSCRDGGDLADLISALPGLGGSCGEPEMLCALDHLIIVLKSPDLSDALSGMDFEGSVGKEGFQSLIIHVMDATAAPGFDPSALSDQLRNLLGERLDGSTLDALEALLHSFGGMTGDPSIREPWARVVSCVKRYDPERSVSGLTYDLLTDDSASGPGVAEGLNDLTEDLDRTALLQEWRVLAAKAAGDPGLREQISLGLRPLLTPTLARLLSPRVVELQARGVLLEWTRLIEEGLSCD